MQEIHTHTRAVAGKSFPNVLTKRSIQYKYDDYSIIRLIFSHRDHCAIKISKKKLKKKFFEKKQNKKIEKFVKLKWYRAGKSIPALGLGMGLSCNSSSVGIDFLHSFMSGLPQPAC